MKEELCVMYLDDVTLGGSVDVIMEDLDIIEQAADELGFHLNHLKSKVICEEGTRATSAQSGAQWVNPASATVLGSSVGDLFSISTLIKGKISVLKRMGERLKHLPSHDALLLLRHSLAIPKLLYSLRSAACFLSRLMMWN